MFSTGFSSFEELSEEDSEAEELSEDEADELSEETELSEEALVSVLEEDEEELLSAFGSEEVSLLSLAEDSETEELSLLPGVISIIWELLSEERFPRTASFSITSGSLLVSQPAKAISSSAERKTQIIFFNPLPSFFGYYK